jgi:hypothetical protein
MGVILAIVVFSHEGADEQEADVREFITTYRTRFTSTKASSLSREIDRFCHFITTLGMLRHVNTRKKPPRSCIFPTCQRLFERERAGDRWSREIVHNSVASLVHDVSSINNNALSALASANPTAIGMTTRKPATNDFAMPR